MSFRKYGGMNYAATHNIVKSNVNTSDSLYVTNNVGQSNSYINFYSDISGNVLIFGDLDLSGNLNVSGDIDCSGNLNVEGNCFFNDDVDISGNLNIYGDVDCSGNLNVSGILTVSGSIDFSGNNISLAGIECTGNLTVDGYSYFYNDVDISGNVTIDGSLDVSGNAKFENDILVNSLTVGKGGGNQNSTTVGVAALYNNINGTENTSIGYSVLFNTIGNFNTAVGSQALYYNTDGNYNTAIGYMSGNIGDASHNSNCTFLGGYTGNKSNAGSNITYNYSSALGYGTLVDVSNQIVLGTINEGVYLPGDYLKIGGTYTSKNFNGFALDVSGSAIFTDNIYARNLYALSDYRIKKNVVPLDDTFTVDNLNPVTYTNTKTLKQDVGLIAHELQEQYPFLVDKIKDGDQLQSVNYIGLIGVLIKEIQSLKKEVSIMNLQIAQLQKK
jgi:cytoskeletal protein CcmA (bactofilin family)